MKVITTIKPQKQVFILVFYFNLIQLIFQNIYSERLLNIIILNVIFIQILITNEKRCIKL